MILQQGAPQSASEGRSLDHPLGFHLWVARSASEGRPSLALRAAKPLGRSDYNQSHATAKTKTADRSGNRTTTRREDGKVFVTLAVRIFCLLCLTPFPDPMRKPCPVSAAAAGFFALANRL